MAPPEKDRLPGDEDDKGLPTTDGEETMVSTDALTDHSAEDALDEEVAHAEERREAEDDAVPDVPKEAEPADAPAAAPAEPAEEEEDPFKDLDPDAVVRSRDPMTGVPARIADPGDVSLLWPLLVLVVPVAVITLGAILFRDAVYWDFVFKYYWGPIKADGLGMRTIVENGVEASAGFNLVNTASWAILMGALIFLMDRIVKKIEQPVDFPLVLATVPYMMAGSITRVGTDSGLFDPPLMFFLITPIIYVIVVAIATVWIVIGYLLRKHSEDVGPTRALLALGAFLLAVWAAYTIYSLQGDKVNVFANPLVLLVAMVVPYVYFWNYTKQSGHFSQVGVMAVFGVTYLLFAAAYLVLWHTGTQWGGGASAEPQYWIYVAMFVAPAIFVAAVFYVARHMTVGGRASAIVYLLPLNLLLVFAQMMDATMTSVGVDNLTPTTYSEKHVLPAFLIEAVDGSGIPILSEYPATTVMLTAKLIVSLLVVWAIDVYARSDMKDYPNLVGLAKLAIIMVGLAPGTRNAIRMALQV
ncbi:MAG: DUF63 family protein [Euryarchaeota archaeon]|nr:DUF63 family protein [Euryarchaeota archaeon]